MTASEAEPSEEEEEEKQQRQQRQQRQQQQGDYLDALRNSSMWGGYAEVNAVATRLGFTSRIFDRHPRHGATR